jgi:hypothetical protein
VTILSSDFIRKTNNIADAQFGCDAKSQNFVDAGALVEFIYQCQIATLGSDLLGLPCTYDSDCLYNGACQVSSMILFSSCFTFCDSIYFIFTRL